LGPGTIFAFEDILGPGTIFAGPIFSFFTKPGFDELRSIYFFNQTVEFPLIKGNCQFLSFFDLIYFTNQILAAISPAESIAFF
jgi:hypothetical protein